VLSILKPSAESMRHFRDAQSKLDLSYANVGTTESEPPPGYVIDHVRIRLGAGEATFQAAKSALQRWEQFRMNWLEFYSRDAPIQAGQHVAFAAKGVCLWWWCICRIVYVIDESGPVSRFGFANGTLPEHMGKGEERFLIEWDRADDSVWYDILAFSRPQHLLARLAYPMFRHAQNRFRRDSTAAMLCAVNGMPSGGCP
jgi:uncharacterized protein (UPF0548 family)